ncbi:hypothetical protein SAMN04488559_10920 [Isobaculum melis]|uniref:Uncharacterized protein n=2 Tax=Isobaculum melis TaxID=142588 RepID=A0A1H9STE0_9LACT|nr:hypothetical protein SAMN04488559_10920 [Isobaculum melis]
MLIFVETLFEAALELGIYLIGTFKEKKYRYAIVGAVLLIVFICLAVYRKA